MPGFDPKTFDASQDALRVTIVGGGGGGAPGDVNIFGQDDTGAWRPILVEPDGTGHYRLAVNTDISSSPAPAVQLIDESNQADGTVTRSVFELTDEDHFKLHIEASAGTANDTVHIQLYTSLHPSANGTSDDHWALVQELDLTVQQDSIVHAYVSDLNDKGKFMLRIAYSYSGGGSPSNAVEVWMQKW